MNVNAIINQRLRDFTVQIVDSDQEDAYDVYGTGFAIDYLGAKFVTCAHVVKHILRGDMTGTVYIRFPQAPKKPILSAKVIAHFDNYDDDVALLQLENPEKMPLKPEQIAVVGKADDSDGNPFQSYGFRRLDKYEALLAKGVIDGQIPPPSDENWCCDYVLQLDSANINRGMSGAALFDKEKNLVVGIISQTYYPDDTSKDRDTAFGVDARALSLAPLGLTLYEGDMYPRKEAMNSIVSAPPLSPARDDLSRAPSALTGWVGRANLLAEIDRHYANPDLRVIGLIGFGGEGKTSLTRKWIQTVLDDEKRKPDGVFWWAFYDNRNTDEFLDVLLRYMAGDAFAQTINSAYARAQIIGAMTQERRYLIVLDGFEVLQHQDGDDYGLITNDAIKTLLELCASAKSQSCCVLTTRAPLVDMQPVTTYQHIDITRLNETDGMALMKELGVTGDDVDIKKVVNQWYGHALTLELISAYLREHYEGDIHKQANIPSPISDESPFERIAKVLKQYDKHLTDLERAFMLVFSAFRLPMPESAFEKIFNISTKSNTSSWAMTYNEFNLMLHGLRLRRLITSIIQDNKIIYTTHPLIRNYYDVLLMKDIYAQQIHHGIASYYKDELKEKIIKPLSSINDLKLYIEMVHHLCCAGKYELAFQIWFEQVNQKNEKLITSKFGAYKIELDILLEFFQDNNINNPPAINDLNKQRLIIDACAFCYQSLGELKNALALWERSGELCNFLGDMKNASNAQHNISHIYIVLGKLEDAIKTANYSLELAEKISFTYRRRFMSYYLLMKSQSLCYQAWSLFLSKKIREESILALFLDAEKLEKQTSRYVGQKVKYLYSIRGIFYARFLSRIGNKDISYKITRYTLEISQKYENVKDEILCYCILGDLEADEGKFDKAIKNYNNAIECMRKIDKLDTHIEALLARGRFYAKHMKDAKSAFNDLNEALATAIRGEYRLYEADIRIGLAWAYLAEGKKDDAKREAEIARTMSKSMGYHWGGVDAEEILKHLQG